MTRCALCLICPRSSLKGLLWKLTKMSLVLMVLLAAGLLPARTTSLPSALDRAQDALHGLVEHFTQTETGVSPSPRPEGCPCFSCGGKNCTPPTCGYCSVMADANCVTPQSPGCYTTASAACMCNEPEVGPDPAAVNKPAQFYFSCGQIGGLGGHNQVGTVSPDKCQCESDWMFGCTSCYRWWSAVALEASVNYCIATGLPWNSTGLCGDVFNRSVSMWAHAPYNKYWDGSISAVYVDDFTWYALAYLRVYDWTGDEVWRDRAVGLHDWAWKYGWDQRVVRSTNDTCGGFWWSLWPQWPFKNSITIVEMLHTATKIASTFDDTSNRTKFTDSALRIWKWIFSFDEGLGLFASNGVMSTGAVPEWCCSPLGEAQGSNLTNPSPACSNSRAPGRSYNHGLLMSSAAFLYDITKDKHYFDVAMQLLAAASQNLTDNSGAIADAQRGSRVFDSGRCACGSDPGSDFFSFKGVFTAHLAYFANTLNSSGVLSADAHSKLISMVKQSSDDAWSKSATFPPFDKTGDTCNPIPTKEFFVDKTTSTNTSYPKFHWWWSNNNASIETPPDAGLWFSRDGLWRSYSSKNTSHGPSPLLWSGQIDSINECQDMCALNTSCVKYMHSTSAIFASNGPLTDNTCPCLTCQGKHCSYPECAWCGTLADKSCPTKNSTGCYTTAPAACSCTEPSPPPEPSTTNCWLYRSFVGNRSHGEACVTMKTGFQVVTKRPPPTSRNQPSSSCRNQCGNSSIERSTSEQAVPCFCDEACPRHLDCCLDYVEHCSPSEEQHPTCVGRCHSDNQRTAENAGIRTDAAAVPIRGGGYCYCDPSCGNIFTDNNSYGGCCGDYPSVCGGSDRDPVCFDARTQGSALHLFVAHHVIESLGGE